MIQINRQTRPAFWKMALSLPIVGVLFFLYSCRTGEVVPAKTPQATTAGMYRMGEVVVVGYGVRPVLKDANEKLSKYNLPVPLSKSEEEVYKRVDEAPSPANGMDDFQKVIQQSIDNANFANTPGTVYVQVTIDAAGNMLNPSIMHGINAQFDAQVLEAVQQKSTKWNPGKIAGTPVSSRLVIPVPFGKTSTPYNSLSELKELSKTPQAGQPVLQEGMYTFYKYIQKYLRYPTEARNNMIEGQVVVGFTVQKDGTLANIEVVESVFPVLDAEVIRVVQESKLLWKPAMQNGQPQESRIVLPVTFKLG